MNGQRKQPPDKGEPNEVPFECGTNDDLILSENDIKQEAVVKEEPIDAGENVMSISYAHTTTGPLSNPFDVVQMTGPADFNDLCDLVDIKSVIKAEEVTKKVDKVSETSHGKGEDDVKKTSSGKRVHAKPSSVDRKIRNWTKAKESNNKKALSPKADKKQHKCLSCEYTTAYMSYMKIHIRKHTGKKPFSCSHCAKRFSHASNLQQHMRTHVAEFLFSCSNCLKGFPQLNEKMEHEVACNVRRYECDLCKKYSTLHKAHFKTHMRVHTGDRPFRCDQCLKKFKLQNHLDNHKKTHSNPRPPTFKCSICYRSFPQQMEKDEHEENCKKRGYECYLCKCFKSPKKSHLVQHMHAQHTGDKPFRCEICAKCFLRKGHLIRHKKIHKPLSS